MSRAYRLQSIPSFSEGEKRLGKAFRTIALIPLPPVHPNDLTFLPSGRALGCAGSAPGGDIRVSTADLGVVEKGHGRVPGGVAAEDAADATDAAGEAVAPLTLPDSSRLNDGQETMIDSSEH